AGEVVEIAEVTAGWVRLADEEKDDRDVSPRAALRVEGSHEKDSKQAHPVAFLKTGEIIEAAEVSQGWVRLSDADRKRLDVSEVLINGHEKGLGVLVEISFRLYLARAGGKKQAAGAAGATGDRGFPMSAEENAPESPDAEDWQPVLSFDEAFGDETGDNAKPSVSSRRKQRRAERASIRSAHDRAGTRELRAVFQVLQALPAALPGLGLNGDRPALGREGGYSVFAVLEPEAEDAKASELPAAKKPKGRKHAPEAAEVEAMLEEAAAVLRTDCPYGALPEVFAPAEGLAILSAMIDRPPKYQEKYLGQEWSILTKVWALAGSPTGDEGKDIAVVDIGAGNGSLALLAALLLGGHAVLVDHTLPPEPLRVEGRLPASYQQRVLRVTGDVGDLDAQEALEPVLAKHGLGRVVVIAKHLCGVGTDLALKLLRRWRRDGLTSEAHHAEVLGAVIATCCGHKIGAEDARVYREIHSEDPYLSRITGRSESSANGEEGARLEAFLGICTRCVAWRTTAGANANRITERQVKAAELFEDALQEPRLNLLRSLFPAATEVAFVPAKQSPQNRCLLAGSREGLETALATASDSDTQEKVLSTLMRARDALLSACGGALDLRPHGLVSTRFDYDGT
ncbi:unnamed protein product, partial [Symbiodinium microadriaticum]